MKITAPMTAAEKRRAAKHLATHAAISHRSYTMRGRWDDSDPVVAARHIEHDDMVELAKKLRAAARATK